MKVIVESKKFDKIIRGKLKKMMESLVQLPNGEQKRMSPEEIEQLHYDEVPYEIVQDDIETEVDKETWGDEPEQAEEPVDNSDMISVDDEVEEDDEPQDIVDFLTKKTEPEEVKPNEPAVLSEFDDLSNEEKKALLLKLAKNDNDLNAILGAYLNKKVEEDAAGSEEIVDELNEASFFIRNTALGALLGFNGDWERGKAFARKFPSKEEAQKYIDKNITNPKTKQVVKIINAF